VSGASLAILFIVQLNFKFQINITSTSSIERGEATILSKF